MEIFHAMQQLHLKNYNKKNIKNVPIIACERVQYEIYLLSFDFFSVIRKIPGVATKHFQI